MAWPLMEDFFCGFPYSLILGSSPVVGVVAVVCQLSTTKHQGGTSAPLQPSQEHRRAAHQLGQQRRQQRPQHNQLLCRWCGARCPASPSVRQQR